MREKKKKKKLWIQAADKSQLEPTIGDEREERLARLNHVALFTLKISCRLSREFVKRLGFICRASCPEMASSPGAKMEAGGGA